MIFALWMTWPLLSWRIATSKVNALAAELGARADKERETTGMAVVTKGQNKTAMASGRNDATAV